MRAATIDIGTNTVLLLVAETTATGSISAITERATVTRLGKGVDRTRALAPEAIERTRQCLQDYAAVIGPLRPDRIDVVGTSAMRDAAGGEEVKAIVRTLFGVEARVLSGAEEARLAFRGALSGLSTAGETAVFDIGGGSTEVVIGRPDGEAEPGISFAQSFDIGSVRLTERLVTTDPPSASEISALTGAAKSAFNGVPKLAANAVIVGVAGTMTTLAAVAMGLATYDGSRVHGYGMSRIILAKVLSDLEGMDVRTRRSAAGMEPNRADVIVAGGRIALTLLEHWDAAAVVVSDRGVRWGLAQDLLGQTVAAEGF